MNEVTQILSAIQQGDPRAADKLLPLVYDELRRLAAAMLAHEKPGQTLQATSLVHEAYLRLLGPSPEISKRQDQDPQNSTPAKAGEAMSPSDPDGSGASDIGWNSRGHFFAAAAEAMRRILIDLARRKNSQRRGGDRNRQQLWDDALISHRLAMNSWTSTKPSRNWPTTMPKRRRL
jgi:hypothetical protein